MWPASNSARPHVVLDRVPTVLSRCSAVPFLAYRTLADQTMTSVAIITAYHFNSDNIDAYTRLLCGLRSCLGQLSSEDRLILVANGTQNGAADPDLVLKDVNPSCPECIVPVALSRNARNTGGLNAGITAALRQECEWIATVQSSVIIRGNWLEVLRPQMRECAIDGFSSRLCYEDVKDMIWNDGHYLKEGRTLDVGYKQSLDAPRENLGRWTFPCLSAALFSASAARLVVRTYGDFVSEALAHYGDCTDVALRFARLQRGRFCHVPEALGVKRRPTRNPADIVCSQLLAARRYYRGRVAEASARCRHASQDASDLVGASRLFEILDLKPYSPRRRSPPFVSLAEDREWGRRFACNGGPEV